ncbi:hypothetical protein BIW11_11535 [Tropilaelaps mercedesae]|uniref:Uncharacterized protein n=1 Tax=Tropilaelaps mercedesae TaxID=418985 RepID=A0A1V9XAM6_9ACAR|nr:hypothetical protein BIW11_11535 [Tropilaelaps mercedesae]
MTDYVEVVGAPRKEAGWEMIFVHEPNSRHENEPRQRYENADWGVIAAPLLPLNEPLDLSPELIEETLNYFSK